jgi:hypothetical protein
MFKIFLFLSLTLSFISFSNTASAYTSFGVRGCGKLISVVDSPSEKIKYEKDLTEISVKAWIAGYFTAHNTWMDAVLKKDDSNAIASTDIDGVYMSMLNYCRSNPLQNTVDAIVDTLNQLDTKMKRKR